MTHQAFKTHIWNWYTKNRRSLPWRPPRLTSSQSWCKKHSYEIFISEIMLQQTQVDRVIPFFQNFLEELPDWESLAKCPQPKLLKLWKGLGYNRRALNTKKAAQYILEHHNGVLPQDLAELQKIPNVGVYTSAAIMNFIHGIATPLIETNVRTVYFHHFYPNQSEIPDEKIMKKVVATFPDAQSLPEFSPRTPGHLPESLQGFSPREWMYALMDYGSHLRREGIKITNKSKHYTKQKSFKGSKREIRGKILEILLHEPLLSPEILEQKISDELKDNENNIQRVIEDMIKEGFVEETKKGISIKNT